MEVSITRNGRIATLTFESGSMHRRLREDLWESILLLDEDSDVDAVIVTGRRNVFLAGADLKEVLALENEAAVAEFLSLPHRLVNKFCHAKKLLIAAINGYCLGGGLELALACDIRVAVDDFCDSAGRPIPFIGFPETQIGLTPALGGAHLAATVIGVGRAKELLFDARPITAQRAYEIGLVNRLVPRANLLAETEAAVNSYLNNSGLALSATKRLLGESPYSPNLDGALCDAMHAFAECCISGETRDRIARSREAQRQRFRNVAGAA
jgi:enoyl-CoA hydratase/carnithine racemase